MHMMPAGGPRHIGWRLRHRSIPSPTRRCLACFPRGVKTWWPNVEECSRQPSRAPTRPPPRRDSRNALSPPSRTHLAWHTTAGLLLARPPPTSFGGPARHQDAGSKDRGPKNECIEAEVEASGTTLTEIFGIGPILAARIIGTIGNARGFPTPRPTTSLPTQARRRWKPQAGRWCATGSLWPATASSTTLCT